MPTRRIATAAAIAATTLAATIAAAGPVSASPSPNGSTVANSKPA